MLLFDINRTAYVGSLFVQLHLTSVTLIGQSQGHLDFEALFIVKGQMLLLNINRKVCMGDPLVQYILTFVNLKSHCQGHSNLKTYI